MRGKDASITSDRRLAPHHRMPLGVLLAAGCLGAVLGSASLQVLTWVGITFGWWTTVLAGGIGGGVAGMFALAAWWDWQDRRLERELRGKLALYSCSCGRTLTLRPREELECCRRRYD